MSKVYIDKDILGNLYIKGGEISNGEMEILSQEFHNFNGWMETIPNKLTVGWYDMTFDESWDFDHTECEVIPKFTPVKDDITQKHLLYVKDKIENHHRYFVSPFLRKIRDTLYQMNNKNIITLLDFLLDSIFFLEENLDKTKKELIGCKISSGKSRLLKDEFYD